MSGEAELPVTTEHEANDTNIVLNSIESLLQECKAAKVKAVSLKRQGNLGGAKEKLLEYKALQKV